MSQYCKRDLHFCSREVNFETVSLGSAAAKDACIYLK